MENRIKALEERIAALEEQAQKRQVNYEAMDKGALEVLKRITANRHQSSFPEQP